jgi:hypothetical protein
MSKKSPLAIVNEKFGGKDKLVDALTGLLESDESKDDLRKRLLGVSNTKLLRLHAVASDVKTTYGGREKLVSAAATALNSAKDKDYVAKLGALPTKKLYDVTKAAERRAKRAAAK